MTPKKKTTTTDDARKAPATAASVMAYCAAEYRARIGATWTVATHRNVLGKIDGVPLANAEADPLADALDELRAAALKVARLAGPVPTPFVAAVTGLIIATDPLWNWRLPAVPALRKVIVRNAATYYTRKLENYELAIISILCGSPPNMNRADTVHDVVQREADAMRRVRERTRTARTP